MTTKELKELIKEVIVERLNEGEWSPEKPPLPWGYANPHGHKFEDTAPQNVAIMPIWKALKSNPSYTDVSVVPWSFAGDKQNRVRAEAHGVIDGKRVTFSAYGPNDVDVEVVNQNDGKSIKKKLSSVDDAINFSKTLSTKLEANTSELEKLGFEPVKESGGYEDQITNAMDRQKYVALRKMEKAHLLKSKMTKDTKRQNHLDMANQYLDQALDIARKYGAVNEDWKDTAKALAYTGAMIAAPIAASKIAPTLHHSGTAYRRAALPNDMNKVKKMTIDGKEVYVFDLGKGRHGAKLGMGYAPIKESGVDKSALHKELIKIKDRIKYIRSYTNHGETLSGSHVKDHKEIGDLQDRAKEILSQLKLKTEDDVPTDGLSEMKLIGGSKVSKELEYHLVKKLSLTENVFRTYSDAYFALINEVRELYHRNEIELCDPDAELVESDLGKKAIYEGREVYLDAPIEEEEDLMMEVKHRGKNVHLNRPFRTPGGPKKYAVYVKSKGGNIKKVTFGDPGLRVRGSSKARRKSFAARHKCSQKKDRTTAGYWSCRSHRIKSLGNKGKGRYW